jgi:hypothetical protein
MKIYSLKDALFYPPTWKLIDAGHATGRKLIVCRHVETEVTAF